MESVITYQLFDPAMSNYDIARELSNNSSGVEIFSRHDLNGIFCIQGLDPWHESWVGSRTADGYLHLDEGRPSLQTAAARIATIVINQETRELLKSQHRQLQVKIAAIDLRLHNWEGGNNQNDDFATGCGQLLQDLHAIAGIAYFLGFRQLIQISRATENLVSALQNGTVKFDSTDLAVMSHARQLMSDLLSHLEKITPQVLMEMENGIPDLPVSPLCEQISTLLAPAVSN